VDHEALKKNQKAELDSLWELTDFFHRQGNGQDKSLYYVSGALSERSELIRILIRQGYDLEAVSKITSLSKEEITEAIKVPL
jgi:hypothetical protein